MVPLIRTNFGYGHKVLLAHYSEEPRYRAFYAHLRSRLNFREDDDGNGIIPQPDNPAQAAEIYLILSTLKGYRGRFDYE